MEAMDEPAPRVHPYDLAFGREQMDDRLFPPIAEEAQARDQPLHDPERFLFLASVGKLLRAVATGDPDPDGSAPASPEGDTGSGSDMGEELRQHGRLLYHAFHYWHAGRRTLAVDEAALRRLVEEPVSLGDWRLTAPAPAGYLRLPRNIVWAAPAEGHAPEPVDGFFWTLLREGPRALHLLLTLGVREDRPGFSVIPATGIPDDEAHWADVDARPEGTDFETTLPGGELDRLYSLETPAEVLKLASLCFYRLDPASG